MPFSLQSIVADLPLVGFQTLNFHRHEGPMYRNDEQASKITIFIGRNGCGKSTLLRELLYWARQKNGEKRLNKEHRILKEVRVDSQIFSNDVPSKVIALSFTPFDKFPPRDDMSNDYSSSHPFYVYLGFKNQYGASGSRSKLLQIIEQVIFRSDSWSFSSGMSHILSVIGYNPALEVKYRLTRKFVDIYGKFRDEFASQKRLELEEISLDEASATDRRRINDFHRASKYFGNMRVESWIVEGVRVEVDLIERELSPVESMRYGERLERKLMQELISDGFLYLESVSLQKEPSYGGWVDLFELSSGELNLIVAFLGLGIHLRDNALVLIDEPENSLHPAWQEKYAELLEMAFANFKGCQFIVATHSPIILAGVAKTDTAVLRLDEEPCNLNGRDFDGVSPDATLVGGFGVITEGNTYLRQLALEALTLIQSGQASDPRFEIIQRLFRDNIHRIPETDKILELARAIADRR